MDETTSVEELLTAEEAAPLLRCEPDWLKRAAARGLVPSHKVGRRRLFTKADLQEFINRSAQGQDPWARSPKSEARRRAS